MPASPGASPEAEALASLSRLFHEAASRRPRLARPLPPLCRGVCVNDWPRSNVPAHQSLVISSATLEFLPLPSAAFPPISTGKKKAAGSPPRPPTHSSAPTGSSPSGSAEALSLVQRVRTFLLLHERRPLCSQPHSSTLCVFGNKVCQIEFGSQGQTD